MRHGSRSLGEFPLKPLALLTVRPCPRFLVGGTSHPPIAANSDFQYSETVQLLTIDGLPGKVSKVTKSVPPKNDWNFIVLQGQGCAVWVPQVFASADTGCIPIALIASSSVIPTLSRKLASPELNAAIGALCATGPALWGTQPGRSAIVRKNRASDKRLNIDLSQFDPPSRFSAPRTRARSRGCRCGKSAPQGATYLIAGPLGSNGSNADHFRAVATA
jgi:hypothetical protein